MMESVKWSHLLCIILSKYDVSILKNERLVFCAKQKGNRKQLAHKQQRSNIYYCA